MSVILVASLVVAACGGATPAATDAPPAGPTQQATGGAGVTEPPPASPEPATAQPPASLEPGEIQFRVVNVYLDESGSPAPVDVYVRSQGLVEAAPVTTDLPYGEATDYFAPPDPGTVVVTAAGAGDPTCVGDCPHFISSSSTGFGEGNVRTLVIYDDGTQELWHDPEPDSVGSAGNALRPADPSMALILTVPVGLQNADFGLRLAYEGVAGCQVNAESESVLVGGNQVGAFGFDGGSVNVTLHDNRDQECAEAPVGGPFEVSADAGERVLLVLFGEPGAMEALTLEV